jgi:dUTP pyrophosphatase
MKLLVKLLHPNAKLPKVAYGRNENGRYGSAGIDLFSVEDVTILPFNIGIVRLGIATEFPPEYVGILKDRSSMGKRGFHVFGGVFDSNYRGEWILLLYNATSYLSTIFSGEKVTQVIFQKLPEVSIHLVNELSSTDRGEGKWGSSNE